LRAGAQLRFGLSRRGCRAYLAVAGGFDLPAVLGSRSTWLRGGFGGLEGRALKHGDRLPLKPQANARFASLRALLPESKTGFAAPHWAASAHPERLGRHPQTVRFVPGRHWESIGGDARLQFLNTEYRVGASSDRMGYRLEGGALDPHGCDPVHSESTAFGTIQLPPDGNPIVLMADRQTTGGYPRIGEVAGVDLPLLAQVRPGGHLKFERIALAEAQRLWHLQSRAVAQIREAVAMHMGDAR
jgi:antagonist of KipI